MAKGRSGEACPEISIMTARVLELSAPQVAWAENGGTSVVLKRRVRRAAEESESAGEAEAGPVRRRKRPAQPTAEQARRPPSVRSESVKRKREATGARPVETSPTLAEGSDGSIKRKSATPAPSVNDTTTRCRRVQGQTSEQLCEVLRRDLDACAVGLGERG